MTKIRRTVKHPKKILRAYRYADSVDPSEVGVKGVREGNTSSHTKYIVQTGAFRHMLFTIFLARAGWVSTSLMSVLWWTGRHHSALRASTRWLEGKPYFNWTLPNLCCTLHATAFLASTHPIHPDSSCTHYLLPPQQLRDSAFVTLNYLYTLQLNQWARVDDLGCLHLLYISFCW